MTMRSLAPWRWGNRTVPSTGTDSLDMFQQEMNRLFDEFFKGFGLQTSGQAAEAVISFAPQVDMTEDANEIRVCAELPGIDEKDIDLNVSRDSLTIKGEKKEGKELKEKESYYMERSYGSFKRVIPLPTEINPDKAEAVFSKGVLTITMPKALKEKKEQKKVEVKST
jgi:HSP20 family protein